MVLKFYRSVTKELKLKVKQFWELIPTFVEITGKKTGRSSIMNRVKSDSTTDNYKKSNLLPTLVPAHLSARRRQ